MRPTIEWAGDKIIMIDQRRLPLEEVWVECRTYEQAAEAIETMVIRGAPAIGVAAAMGIALGMLDVKAGEDRTAAYARVHERLYRTRPTARNLFWALERMKAVFEAHRAAALPELQKILIAEALEIDREDEELCRRVGANGEALIKDGDAVLNEGSSVRLGRPDGNSPFSPTKPARFYRERD
jgi:methylthioribose-1-phosphate isomerase